MPEDRSLDEFVADRSARTESDDAEAPSESVESPSESVESPSESVESPSESVESPSESVAPAKSTSSWTAGGVDCDRCGDPVERRWREDGSFVCTDCKNW